MYIFQKHVCKEEENEPSYKLHMCAKTQAPVHACLTHHVSVNGYALFAGKYY